MVTLSLIVNVLVLMPVLRGLLSKTSGSEAAFGPDQPSRRILISVYLAIALLSALLLAWPGARMALAPGLLSVQVIYKLVTLVLLGIGHPVAMANLAIAALHSVTLWTLIL